MIVTRIYAAADGSACLNAWTRFAPFSLEKMCYDPKSETVIYRSRMHKTLKRNFQIMHGTDWLAQLDAHIPDRFEHPVRYAGWYSNRSRGKRRRMATLTTEVATREVDMRCARALDLGAPDSQGLRGRSARMPEVQGPQPAVAPPRPAAQILTYHPVPEIA